MSAKYPRAAPAGMMSIAVEMASSRLPVRRVRIVTSAAAPATVTADTRRSRCRSSERTGLGTVKAKAESL